MTFLLGSLVGFLFGAFLISVFTRNTRDVDEATIQEMQKRIDRYEGTDAYSDFAVDAAREDRVFGGR